MINPFKRKQVSTIEPYRLTDELIEQAKKLVQLNQSVSFTFTDDTGKVFKRRVKVIDVDYSRNLATIQYLDSDNWVWLDVPIFEEYPIYPVY